MEWLELNQVDARERYESLLENNFRDSYILSTLASQSEKKLRYQLTDAYEEIISQINDGINSGKLNYSKKKYYTDCYFGIETIGRCWSGRFSECRKIHSSIYSFGCASENSQLSVYYTGTEPGYRFLS